MSGRVTTPELLDALEVSRATLYRWRAAGVVPECYEWGDFRRATGKSWGAANYPKTYPAGTVALLLDVKKALSTGRKLDDVAKEFAPLAKRLKPRQRG